MSIKIKKIIEKRTYSMSLQIHQPQKFSGFEEMMNCIQVYKFATQIIYLIRSKMQLPIHIIIKIFFPSHNTAFLNYFLNKLVFYKIRNIMVSYRYNYLILF